MNSMFRKAVTAGAISLLATLPATLAAQQALQGTTGTDNSAPVTESPAAIPQSTNPADSREGSGAPLLQVPGGSDGKTTARINWPISLFTPGQIRHLKVLDAKGDQLGKVSNVMRSRKDGLIHVVVSSGGILGIGATDIAVPVNELQLVGHDLQIDVTKRVFRSWPEYESDAYVELKPGNQPISEFSAFEAIPPR